MKNKMTSELSFENALTEKDRMRIFPDSDGTTDLVGFNILKDNEPNEEYFHLDKFNIGCLIDFLKRIYDDMDNDS